MILPPSRLPYLWDMVALLTISFGLNLMILGIIIPAILRNSPAMVAAYGPASAARGILVSVYLAIMALSGVGVACIVLGQIETARILGYALLPVQVCYKLLSWPMVGLSNPVVRANLGIAALHAITLWQIL